MKTVYLENLGCSKNQVDAEVMLALLTGEFSRTEDPAAADLIIVNTCGFIESARAEAIGSFFDLHASNPEAKIIFSGCMAQRYADELSTELREASAIFGNHDLSRLPEVVARVFSDERVVSTPEYPTSSSEDAYKRNQLLSFYGSAYVKISEGCNHRCSYCAIPIIRGSLRSKPMAIILEEITSLAARGAKEINLIGQDLASWGKDMQEADLNFMTLLKRITEVDGDFVIRLLYIHPDMFPLELLDFIRNHPKVLPYFDIPFQHADEKILRSMGRKGTVESHLALIQTIREMLPDSVIRSTILLGYPGEDDDSFRAVMDFLRRAQLDWVGSFVYSLEEGTKAAALTNERNHKKLVSKARKAQRELEELQLSITQARLAAFAGREMDVLIEEHVEGEDLYIGRTYAQAPEVDGLTVVLARDLVPGAVVRCGITRVNGIDLEAIPLSGGHDGFH
ncbi:MAG TPA: 30S ribosomal protein S12 methylthiotransferase RimO [Sphaerochaeta sp.]|nr:30S ribosomal protein S12 methylthiotransferase RimO [Sphaerochaeta sp.]HQB55026.1 30S ribosomal protein S12 methylthiotransferase RimO [Sphaerochaeta sp.]